MLVEDIYSKSKSSNLLKKKKDTQLSRYLETKKSGENSCKSKNGKQERIKTKI